MGNIIMFILAVALFLTNPEKGDFIKFGIQKVYPMIAVVAETSDSKDSEAYYNMLAMFAGPMIERKNYYIFSIFSISDGEDSGKVLGIANNFFLLNESSNKTINSNTPEIPAQSNEKNISSLNTTDENSNKESKSKDVSEIIRANGIEITEMETVKEKNNKVLVIINKNSDNPYILIIEKEYGNIEFSQNGVLSSDIDLALGDKNKNIHWVIKSINTLDGVCTENIIDINMGILEANIIYSGQYPSTQEHMGWLKNYETNSDLALDKDFQTYKNAKKDMNGDGFKDIVIYGKGLKNHNKIFDKTIVLYATNNGFSL